MGTRFGCMFFACSPVISNPSRFKCWPAGAGLAAVAVLAAVVLSPRAAFAESEVKMYVGQAHF